MTTSALALVWLLLFPLVLATAVWGSWEPWLRLALVCCFALVWLTMFFPRKRKPRRCRRSVVPALTLR